MVSDDGFTWERASEPILTPDMLTNQTAFWYPASVIADDSYYLFIELLPASSVTDIYTITADVSALLALTE